MLNGKTENWVSGESWWKRIFGWEEQPDVSGVQNDPCKTYISICKIDLSRRDL